MAFDFDGEKYRKASAHQKQWGLKLIAELDLAGSERVLDLGCGDGALTAQIADSLPRGSVLGIDASEGMIASARKHVRTNLAFELLDINEIDFHEEFDLVFSNATLHWVKDHRRLLANVLAALKNSGFARFNFAADGNCSQLYKVLRDVMARDEFADYFREFDWPWYMPAIDEYRWLAGEAGFHEAEVWGASADRYFPDVDAMVRWIDQPSLVPFLKHVAEPDRQGFRDAVVEGMILACRQDDGRCFETFRRVNFRARKADHGS